MVQKQESKTSSFDEGLQEELSQLEMHGDEEGKVECEIMNVKKSGDYALIKFKPPLGDTFKKKTKIPRTKSDNSLLLDILQNKGYGLVAADQIIGEFVKFERNNNKWEYSDRSLSTMKSLASYLTLAGKIHDIEPRAGPDRLSDAFQLSSAIISLPIVSLIAFLILVNGENVGTDDYVVGLTLSGLSTALWVTVIGFLFFM